MLFIGDTSPKPSRIFIAVAFRRRYRDYCRVHGFSQNLFTL